MPSPYIAFYTDGSSKVLPNGISFDERVEGMLVNCIDPNETNKTDWWCWTCSRGLRPSKDKWAWLTVPAEDLPIHVKVALATRLITGELS